MNIDSTSGSRQLCADVLQSYNEGLITPGEAATRLCFFAAEIAGENEIAEIADLSGQAKAILDAERAAWWADWQAGRTDVHPPLH